MGGPYRWSVPPAPPAPLRPLDPLPVAVRVTEAWLVVGAAGCVLAALALLYAGVW